MPGDQHSDIGATAPDFAGGCRMGAGGALARPRRLIRGASSAASRVETPPRDHRSTIPTPKDAASRAMTGGASPVGFRIFSGFPPSTHRGRKKPKIF
jgi:hypothetical protein